MDRYLTEDKIYETANNLVKLTNRLKKEMDENETGEEPKFYSVIPQMEDKYVHLYGWAIASRKAVKEIAKFVGKKTILEIGAGMGMYAYLLSCSGVKVIATDSKDEFTEKNRKRTVKKYKIKSDMKNFYDVENLDAINALKKYKGGKNMALMLIWPRDYASISLKKYVGDKLIYIGEDDGGCTGNDEFFELLDKNWKLVKKVKIFSRTYIHDSLFLYKRK